MIYLDNAATTLDKPEAVAKAVYEAITTMGNASRGAHEATLSSMRMISETRQLLATMFNFSHPERVIFTNNATESLNTAILGLFEKGDNVITTACEHNSVLRPLYLLEKQGIISLTIIPCDEIGNVDYDLMEKSINDDTRAIICTHASNLTGNINDISYIGKLCKLRGLLFLVDASQTAGIIPIDMKKEGISVLCFTGHKGLLGPQGTGGMCVEEGIHIRPLKVGGSGILTYEKEHPCVYPTALEAGTLNSHSIAGLNASLKYLIDIGIDNISRLEQDRVITFYNGVKEIPDVKIYGNFEDMERAAIVSLNIGDYDSSAVSDELMQRFEIATRPGAHCAPLMHKALNTVNQGAVRFSFSHRNSMEDVTKAVEAVRILATEE